MSLNTECQYHTSPKSVGFLVGQKEEKDWDVRKLKYKNLFGQTAWGQRRGGLRMVDKSLFSCGTRDRFHTCADYVAMTP